MRICALSSKNSIDEQLVFMVLKSVPFGIDSEIRWLKSSVVTVEGSVYILYESFILTDPFSYNK